MQPEQPASYKENGSGTPAKFRSETDLAGAYAHLEAAFTQKSQYLARLKAQMANLPKESQKAFLERHPQGEGWLNALLEKHASLSPAQELTRLYALLYEGQKAPAEEAPAQPTPPPLLSGRLPASPRKTAKTLEEAGRYAREYLK